MFDWLRTTVKRNPGWLALSFSADALDYVHARPEAGGASVQAFGSRPLGAGSASAQRIAQDLHVSRYRCSTLMAAGEYQMFQVEAPNVPAAEVKAAVRWRVKDMVDYDIADATIDVLDIPLGKGSTGTRHYMFAVSARNPLIGERIQCFDAAGIALEAIDVPETAQRNIAALSESGDRGVSLVYFAEDWGLLTINYRAELLLARRLEFGLKALAHADEASRTEALERATLELQRTLDNFERQYGDISVSKLLVAPLSQDLRLAEHLAANLALPVESIDLARVLSFAGEPPDRATQWRLFHHFGAALRDEPA